MLVYDIETAENERAPEYYADKEYAPDANFKSVDEPPSKITDLKNEQLREQRLAEWRENQAAKLEAHVKAKMDKDYARAPLNWWTGKIICICTIDTDTKEERTFYGAEKGLLTNFFRYISTLEAPLIGKSSDDFDRPYIIGRALANEMAIPNIIRPQHGITDINQIFSYRSACSQVTSLANYAWGLGIEGKSGHGSEVGKWFKAGEHTKIQEYCMQDTRLTAEILRRANLIYV